MSYSRISNLLPSRSLAETVCITAPFLLVHIAAYLDREQDIESSAPISFSLVSQILAACHSTATLFKVLENVKRAGQHLNPSPYKRASAAMMVGSIGSAIGMWATGDSKVNLALGVGNATSNLLGRVFSSAHRNAIKNTMDYDINFNDLLDPTLYSPCP